LLSLQIDNLGKKFGSEWIFRGLSYQLHAGEKLVIQGGNGSGKSTLLQIISGYVSPNEGKIMYALNDLPQNFNHDNQKLFTHISFASPYLQLTEDFTLHELVKHCSFFKSFLDNKNPDEVIEIADLGHAKNKLVRQFSSGMKQRLKLALAIMANTPLLLLDEPVSNLDKNAIFWYRNLIELYTKHRTVIVCSNNIEEEYFFCDKVINVSDYKRKI
jgi:ABC-type multidrug transport system ATPase subunit